MGKIKETNRSTWAEFRWRVKRAQTRKCLHHERRPPMCRDYPEGEPCIREGGPSGARNHGVKVPNSGLDSTLAEKVGSDTGQGGNGAE